MLNFILTAQLMITNFVSKINPSLAGLIEDFTSTVAEWITAIVSFIVASFAGVIPIFYSSTEGFTFYGILMLFALAVGFVSLALGWLTRLLKK